MGEIDPAIAADEECQHIKVQRCKDPYEKEYADMWVCFDCGIEFLPGYALKEAMEALEAESDKIIDTATAMFSAMLWDLHQKAGVPQADSSVTKQEALRAICEEEGHVDLDQGECSRCGYSPFLGGGN